MNWTHTYQGERVRVVEPGRAEDGDRRVAVIEYENPETVVITMSDTAPRRFLSRFGVVRASELTPL